MDSNEESESESEKSEEEEECDPDVELHDRRIEYLFELAKKCWDFHPFVVDILREVRNHIALDTFNSLNAPQFNRRDPIPEGPQGIQLLDDLAVVYDAVGVSLFDRVGGV
jgi:hypothetical protein